MHPFLAEGADQCLGNLVSAARFRNEFAEHGAKPEHDADKAKDPTETVLKGLHHQFRRHAGGEPQEARGDGQRDKWVYLEARDEKYEADDGHTSINQKIGL